MYPFILFFSQDCLKLFARLAKDNVGFIDWSPYLATVSKIDLFFFEQLETSTSPPPWQLGVVDTVFQAWGLEFELYLGGVGNSNWTCQVFPAE